MASDPADPNSSEAAGDARAVATAGAGDAAAALAPAHVGGGPRRKSVLVWAILVSGICCFAWAAAHAVNLVGGGTP